MNDLPNDALLFLREGRQFSYDANESGIGRIMLKKASELTPSILGITFYDSAGLDDPYCDLNGIYQVEVVDFVKSSEDYGSVLLAHTYGASRASP